MSRHQLPPEIKGKISDLFYDFLFPGNEKMILQMRKKVEELTADVLAEEGEKVLEAGRILSLIETSGAHLGWMKADIIKQKIHEFKQKNLTPKGNK